MIESAAMRHWMLGLGVGLWAAFVFGGVTAQTDDLAAEEVQVTNHLDLFGLEQSFAIGTLSNESADAYQNIRLSAEVYDADENLIGEGLGYLVRACGEALDADFALQPDQRAPFSVQLDLFEADVLIDRVEIIAQGETTPATLTAAAGDLPGITRLSSAEVVDVEWIDGDSLRYSSGCWRDVFTNRAWFEYHRSSGITEPITHPRAADVTDALRAAIRLDDPALFNRSFFSFAPGGRRAVYQTDLNTLATVEPDGSFVRVLYDELFNISLQGINWHKNSGTFLAYYHGGYGDEVRYLVANADGRQFSQHPMVALPSISVPGFAANGRGVVITTTGDAGTGYYLKPTTTDNLIPMFEAEPPGNNWPAPFYEITPEGSRWIYIARPVEGEARLQCYNPDSRQLHDLTALPLNLATDERGWLWLSPDNQTLALAANGLNGGLWWIDLTQFEACD
ncbi:MAG: hypothetical protein K8J31_25300 [Anaerolineae bacterium]|nr:hypothetical protein [Anaerolineae bacterium]